LLHESSNELRTDMRKHVGSPQMRLSSYSTRGLTTNPSQVYSPLRVSSLPALELAFRGNSKRGLVF
jgi:hypothetical protein